MDGMFPFLDWCTRNGGKEEEDGKGVKKEEEEEEAIDFCVTAQRTSGAVLRLERSFTSDDVVRENIHSHLALVLS